MTRHEYWRREYQLNRYMKNLTDIEAEQRAKDIFINYFALDHLCRITMRFPFDDKDFWLSRGTHLLEEFSIRFGPYPSGFDSGFLRQMAFPNPNDRAAPAAVRAVKGFPRLSRGSYLVKYGKYRYLKDAHENGRIRIAPASSYRDPSLNPAVQDDELRLRIPLQGDTRLIFTDPRGGTKDMRVEDSAWVIEGNDYYVYCLSESLDSRLFLNFEADACLIVTDPAAFMHRINAAVFERLPASKHSAGRPAYVDPLMVGVQEVRGSRVSSLKHFRYAYQQEFRLVWDGGEEQPGLDTLLVEVGELRQFTELLQLS